MQCLNKEGEGLNNIEFLNKNKIIYKNNCYYIF